MNCPDLRELSAFFDEHLASPSRQAIERHVTGCSPCTARLADFARMRREFGVLRDVRAPARLLARLAAAAPRRPASPRLSMCAAAALLGGLSLLLVATALEPWRRETLLERHLERALPLFEASADQLIPPELALLRQVAAREKVR